MFTSGHPVCRFYKDHRRSKTSKWSLKRDELQKWTTTQSLQAPPGREGSEGMLQYVVIKVVSSEPLGVKMENCSHGGSRTSQMKKFYKALHVEAMFCDAHFVFNHFLIEATHVPLLELIATVGIQGSMAHLKNLQLLLVKAGHER